MLDIHNSSVRCLGLGKNKFEGLATRDLGKSHINGPFRIYNKRMKIFVFNVNIP